MEPDELIGIIENGDVPVFKAWLDKGGDPNAFIARAGCEGTTVLVHVVMSMDEPEGNEALTEMVAMLIEKGVDVNNGRKEDTDYPPVFWAILENQPVITRMLLEAGASLEFRTSEGETALSRAMEYEYWEMMELLVPYASLSLINSWTSPSCDPPLGMAFRTLNFPMMELLLKHGADPHACDPDDGTALDNIPQGTDPEIVGYIHALIRKYGKDPERDQNR